MMLPKKTTSGFHRVVVTGMGVASPLGCTVNEFWAKLLEGRSGIRTLTDIDLSQYRTRIGAPVVGYDASLFFSPRELQRLSRSSQLAMVTASAAVTNADLDLTQFDPSQVGVILGSSGGGFVASEPFFQDLFAGSSANPLIIPVIMNNSPASNVSIRFRTRGPLITIDAACASSAHAIGYAFNLIRFGLLQVALTGGADTALSKGAMYAWGSIRALSERNETPGEACRPFSRDRDGTVLGEGAGILVLESEISAIKRNAKILAEVTGYAATSDGYHITQSDLGGNSEAMRHALEDAGLTPAQIDYINAHATATPWNDKIETAAIKRVFGSHAYDIPVVGIKAAIGHSMAASGALEFISCILSIRDGVVPPTINVKVPDLECDLDYVTEGARACEVTHAMSNSFAFGGSNAVLIVSRYTA